MVGTTRFELATSPTPRVRSTRLSHVPTMVCTSPRRAAAGYLADLSVHEYVRQRPFPASAWGLRILWGGSRRRQKNRRSSVPRETPALRGSKVGDGTHL